MLTSFPQTKEVRETLVSACCANRLVLSARDTERKGSCPVLSCGHSQGRKTKDWLKIVLQHQWGLQEGCYSFLFFFGFLLRLQLKFIFLAYKIYALCKPQHPMVPKSMSKKTKTVKIYHSHPATARNKNLASKESSPKFPGPVDTLCCLARGN